MEEELRRGASKLGIELSESAMEKFKVYHRELLEWNKKINLVSLRDEQRITERHFLDSLSASQFIPAKSRVLDIGSGAGFPGIPIKITRDDICLTLLEPKLKRFNFLNHLAEALKLSIEIHRERVEDFRNHLLFVGAGLPRPYQSYDAILSRSVGKLKWLAYVALPFLAPNGRIITYKGSRFLDEFKEIDNCEILHLKPREFCAGTIAVLRQKI